MALGIGATATLFSVTYGVRIQPLPWPGGDRLVVPKETRGGSPPRFNSFTNAAYLVWAQNPDDDREHRGVVAAHRHHLRPRHPDRIRVTVASPSVFGALNIRPLIGSLFEEKDAVDHPLIVLSEGLWRQRFAANERVLGQIVKLDGEPVHDCWRHIGCV